MNDSGAMVSLANRSGTDTVVGFGGAVGHAVLVALFMGVYPALVFADGWSGPALAVRAGWLAVGLAVGLALMSRSYVRIGSTGIRLGWPSRRSLRWDAIDRVTLDRRRRFGRPTRVCPVVHLTNGTTITIWAESEPAGDAGRIKALIDAAGGVERRPTSPTERPA
jgi:hypothetical protein